MVIRGRRGEEVKIEEDEEYKKLIESKVGFRLKKSIYLLAADREFVW